MKNKYNKYYKNTRNQWVKMKIYIAVDLKMDLGAGAVLHKNSFCLEFLIHNIIFFSFFKIVCKCRFHIQNLIKRHERKK